MKEFNLISFRARFSTADEASEFKDTFYEGKDLADQSEILELPAGHGHGAADDATAYYYGEGGDYEDGQ